MDALLINRKADYALRILRALAQGERLTVQDLVRREGIPQPFAYKITKNLEQAGLLRIVRGAEGGCIICADLRRFSLYDLLRATGENPLVISCMEQDYPCTRPGGGRCGVHGRLYELQDALDRNLKSCSLQYLLFGNETI